MENKLKTFTNDKFGAIRTIVREGVIYFVGKDLATALGYMNPRDALRKHVDAEDKIYGVAIRDAIGREQKVTVVNESGMYALIFGSTLEKAKDFKHWVTSEVLPDIREHGFYLAPELEEAYANPNAIIIGLATRLSEEAAKNAELTAKIAELAQQLKALRPKPDYTVSILQKTSPVTSEQIASDYGMTVQEFAQLLEYLGVQSKKGNVWKFNPPYDDWGWGQYYTYSFTDKDGNFKISHYYKWTQNGRYGLYQLLRRRGILPVIEREDIAK